MCQDFILHVPNATYSVLGLHLGQVEMVHLSKKEKKKEMAVSIIAQL